MPMMSEFRLPALARVSISCTRWYAILSANNWAARVRRAKIVCTLGPASHSPTVIDHLMRAGMDVARLNFSHGLQEEHARVITLIRAASGRQQKPIGILADLQGPKIRTGTLEGGRSVLLRADT